MAKAKINFKDDSLFEKLKLDTKTSSNTLMKKMQLNSSMRKELPKYIKVLKNPKELYLEELFTTYINEKYYVFDDFLKTSRPTNRELVAAIVEYLRNFNAYFNDDTGYIYAFANCLGHVESIDFGKSFNYSKYDKDHAIEDTFISSLHDECCKHIEKYVSETDIKTINLLYDAFRGKTIGKGNPSFSDTLGYAVGNLFESYASRISDKEVLAIVFELLEKLDQKLLRLKSVYPAVKMCVKKIINDADNDVSILEKFPLLASILANDDIKYIESSLLTIIEKYINILNIKDITCNKLNNIKDAILDNIGYIKKHHSNLYQQSKRVYELFMYVSDLSTSEFNTYRSSIINIINRNNLSSNIYDLCSIIAKHAGLYEYKDFYLNILANPSGFEYGLKNMKRLEDNYISSVDHIKNQRKYALYSTFNSMYNSDEVLKPNTVEQFTMDYYGFCILEPELKKVFKNFKDVILYYLSLAENIGDGGNYNSQLTYKGEFIKDFFMYLPGYWKVIGGEKVDHFLKDKVHVYGGSNYSSVEAKSYKNKCKNVKTSTYSSSVNVKCTYTHKTTNACSSEQVKDELIDKLKKKLTNYDKAISLYEKASTSSDYKKVITLLKPNESYKDSKDIITKSKRKETICIKNEKYHDANLLIKQDNHASYTEALSILSSLNGWEDSAALVELCTRRIQEIETEEEYSALVKKVKTEKTERAYLQLSKKFESLGRYKRSAHYYKVCIKRAEEIHNENTYIKAIELSNGDYIEDCEKAVALLESISDWKDSKQKIEEIKDTIEQSYSELYDSAMKAYKAAKSEKEYLEVADLFEQIVKYRDSSEYARKCQDKAEYLKCQKIYNQAKKKLNNALTVNDFKKIIGMFKKAKGYKDSEEQINICQNKIDEIDEIYLDAVEILDQYETKGCDNYLRKSALFEARDKFFKVQHYSNSNDFIDFINKKLKKRRNIKIGIIVSFICILVIVLIAIFVNFM